MSAFLCVLDRSGAPLDRSDLRRLAGTFAGGAATSELCDGPFGLVVRHPASAAARERHGPLVDAASGRVAAVAGTFGWAEDEAEAGDPSLRAAAFALAAGPSESWLPRVAGSFALVLAEPRRGRVEVARDHLGAHKVYLHVGPRWFLAASEPAPLLAHPAVGDALDEVRAVRFLAFDFSHSERSFFRDVAELAPGHRVEVGPGEARTSSYWRFRDRRPSPADTAAAGDELVRRLGRSLAVATAGLPPERFALSLSGGVDSAALAALAPRGARAFSWTFDEVAEGDERERVAAVGRRLGLPVRFVPGEGAEPLAGDFVERFPHPGSPYLNAFAGLKARLYQAARDEGCTHVLVGDAGDALYAAQDEWLRDLLAARRAGAAGALAVTVRAALRGDRAARRALRRLLPVAALRRLVPRRPPRWLTAEARALLPPAEPSPILPPRGRRRRFELAAGARNAELESEEQTLFAQCGVERGDPWWWWPLFELVLALPADRLHLPGRRKLLAHDAFAGRLPREVLAADRGGLLGGFFLRGIERRREWLREEVFRRPRSDWRRWVDSAEVEPWLDATARIDFGHTVLWRVISYELWQRRVIGR